MFSVYLLIALVVIILLRYIFFRNSNYDVKLGGKIPPGPWKVPLIGNLFQLNWKNHLMTFPAIAETHGDICSFELGSRRSLVFSDFKMAKELFTNDPAFAGRLNPCDEVINDMFTTGQAHGIINTEGQQWEELRRFTLRQLRDFGFGKTSMESLIMDELTEVLDWIKSKEGKVMEGIRDKLAIAFFNSLWKIISGQRYAQDDPKVIGLARHVIKALDEAMERGGLIFFIPKLKNLLPELSGYNLIRRAIEPFRETFSNTVAEHKTTYDPSYQRDFMDVFLKEIQSCTDDKSPFYKDFGERNLVGVISDLFLAGTDTSSTTLEWALLYLSTFTEVQKKLQKELDRVVGRSRHCSLTDRPQLPYSQAVLSEVMRFSSIVPSGLPRRALNDRVFHGWAIPAGTGLWINIWAIHRNKEIWGDPENFRPERFLSPDGTMFQKHEALIPFSIGRRQCAAETLARDSLFLYLTNIFQRFELAFDPNDPKANPGFDPRPGIVLMTQPFKVIFKERV